MRAWFACVVAVAGCNQIFGNNSVNPIGGDANQPGIDAGEGAMTVMYAVEAGPAQITTSPTYVAFDTQVHAGPIDIYNPDPTMLELRPVSNGGFTIPYATLAARYRLIFTAPDGVDVELQSQLAHADLVLPRIGRIDRGTPVAHSQVPFEFTNGPTNDFGTWKLARFITTGLWSTFDLGPCCTLTPPATVDYSQFISMSGPLGVPMSATDTFVFTDSVSDGASSLDANHNKVSAYATGTLDGFTAGGVPINLVQSAWKANAAETALHVTTTAFAPTFGTRAANLLNLSSVDLPDPKKAGGVVAAANVLPFTEILVNQTNTPDSVNGDLDHAVFMALGHSLANPIRFVNPFNGVDAPAYPTVFYVQSTATRTYANSTVKVRSGIQAFALQNDGVATQVNIGDGVGFASGITMRPSSVTDGTKDLLLLPDPDEKQLVRNATPMPPAQKVKTFDLWFASDSVDATASIDDCSITIYQVGATTITPVKRYLTNDLPTPTVPLVIEESLFDTTHDYALGISCYHGHPMVKTGDWRTVTYPVAASTIYTKSFKVP